MKFYNNWFVLVGGLCLATCSRFAESFAGARTHSAIQYRHDDSLISSSSNLRRLTSLQQTRRTGRHASPALSSRNGLHHTPDVLQPWKNAFLMLAAGGLLISASSDAAIVDNFHDNFISSMTSENQQVVVRGVYDAPYDISPRSPLTTGILLSLTLTDPSADDYNARAQLLGFADKKDVKDAVMRGKSTLLLDVRTEQEMATSGTLQNIGSRWVASECTTASCPELESTPKAASSIVGKDKDQTIVVYCASGRRAAKAKQVLEANGYTHVLNAGGLKDLDYLRTK